MNSKEEQIRYIDHILRDKETYNYVIYLQKFKKYEKHEEVDRFINTVELFAFGDYLHFLAYKESYIKLDDVLLIKLIRLTILSAASQEGKTMKVNELLANYKLKNAIEHYIEVTDDRRPFEIVFEKICIDMVDESIIEIKFDDIERTILTGKINVIRDCFDSKITSLRILKEEDVINKNLSNALNHLQEWFQNNIKETKTDLDEQIRTVKTTEDINSRKRKPSDNI